jgi:hypothetical protein
MFFSKISFFLNEVPSRLFSARNDFTKFVALNIFYEIMEQVAVNIHSIIADVQNKTSQPKYMTLLLLLYSSVFSWSLFASLQILVLS